MSNETVYWILASILVYMIANLIVWLVYNSFIPIKDELPIAIILATMLIIPLTLLILTLRAYDFFGSLSLRQKTHKN